MYKNYIRTELFFHFIDTIMIKTSPPHVVTCTSPRDNSSCKIVGRSSAKSSNDQVELTPL